MVRKKFCGFNRHRESKAFLFLGHMAELHPNDWWSQVQVEEATDMSRACANRHLRELRDKGLIVRRKIGIKYEYKAHPGGLK